MLGLRTERSTYVSSPLVNTDGYDVPKAVAESMTYLKSVRNEHQVVVGHNLKFDLLYLLQHGYIHYSEFATLKVWDTQLVEYLLSGQTCTYPALDYCSTKYGGTVKDSAIQEFWDAGVPTEKIPTGMLAVYLAGDVENTEIVYLAQRKKVEEWGMSKLVESQMNALKAITLMELEGMSIDREYVTTRLGELSAEIAHREVMANTSTLIPAGYKEWQWSSLKDLSLVLFGGVWKERVHMLVGKYKNGKDKYKWEEEKHPFAGCVIGLPTDFGSTVTKLGYYTVDDAVLKNIIDKVGGGVAGFLHNILKLRELSKQKETYFENLAGLTFPSGKIHANLNLVSTKTGRLSCNKPNIQNQTPEGGIKRAYVSRWGKEGRLVEFDYSQLEMAGLAIVANDKQLTYDINNGIDMHTVLYEEMYGRKPTKDERKKFKPLSFGLVYGAGAKTLSENAKCSLADAKKFIDVFYSRYKGVEKFHRNIQKEADRGKQLTKGHTPKGLPVHAYLKRMPTGRMYVFREYDNEWKGGVSFSPTELKNWPVQGFATGDIVPHMVGYVVGRLCSSHMYEFARPIMTVHDSILFDVHTKVLDKFLRTCYTILSDTSNVVEKWFETDIPVKLSVGCSVGVTWGDMEEVVLASLGE